MKCLGSGIEFNFIYFQTKAQVKSINYPKFNLTGTIYQLVLIIGS